MKAILYGMSAALLTIGGTLPVFSADEHKILTPQDIKWSPGPASLEKGAQFAVIYGDPSKDGLFAMRLKLPKDFKIAPHSHPKPEIVTVISGTFRIGMGDKADPSKAQALAPGGIFAFQPGMTHFASTDEETVVQLNSVGPWAVNYVNAQDDPRQKPK